MPYTAPNNLHGGPHHPTLVLAYPPQEYMLHNIDMALHAIVKNVMEVLPCLIIHITHVVPPHRPICTMRSIVLHQVSQHYNDPHNKLMLTLTNLPPPSKPKHLRISIGKSLKSIKKGKKKGNNMV